jgi:ABC-type uncharacterized transport system ATPase subunit
MQQRVEILKALYRGAELLILDEPTAVLTPQEIEDLLSIMHNLVNDGKAIIIITHELSVVQAICSHVAVISEGRLAESGAVADVFGSPRSAVTKLLLGREE